MRVLEQTEEPKMNPKGNITLQAGMERDLAAIQAKLETLDKEAEKICLVHPEEAVVIKQRTNMLREDWELLIAVLKEHDKKLEETSDLYCFLKVLKHFEAWLSQTGSDIAANQEQPRSLAEAEKLLSKHQQIRKEIAIILTCRLEAHQMWEKSQSLLSRSLSLAAPSSPSARTKPVHSSQVTSVRRKGSPSCSSPGPALGALPPRRFSRLARAPATHRPPLHRFARAFTLRWVWPPHCAHHT